MTPPVTVADTSDVVLDLKRKLVEISEALDVAMAALAKTPILIAFPGNEVGLGTPRDSERVVLGYSYPLERLWLYSDEEMVRLPPFRHLVFRRHPWRRQASLKDRNMTVRQLVGAIKANKWGEEEAADNYDLPVEAIREAFWFADNNQELLAFETAYENQLLEREGYACEARPLPG